MNYLVPTSREVGGVEVTEGEVESVDEGNRVNSSCLRRCKDF